MLDYEKIGKRIQEERKYFRHISQEKMAEDLGMYQADISNLEKAKNGSGITDLSKLEMIAEYFDMPLESLLFGRRQDQMEKYYGTKMKMKESKKKLTRKHETLLFRMMGVSRDSEDADQILENNIRAFECGPYMIYVFHELQQIVSGPASEDGLVNALMKAHIIVVYQDEVIGCLSAGATSVMQHVHQPTLQKLKMLIMPDIFDLDETMTVLNPYWLLFRYAVNEEEQQKILDKLLNRMDELRVAGEERVIFYVESAYVREDCRRNGIFRLMIDVLKQLAPGAMIWLSLEPTSGTELTSEYAYHATYQSSELGQFNMNASIAEHVGFTVDPKTVDRLAERLEEDGTVVTEIVPVRRIAYYLPKRIRAILSGDGDLVEHARARAKMMGEDDKPQINDIFQSAWKQKGFFMSIKMDYPDETVFAFARGFTWESRWLGVSKDNPAPEGIDVETIEKYTRLEDAENSKYYFGLKVAEELLGAIYFGTVNPENVEMNLLQRK